MSSSTEVAVAEFLAAGGVEAAEQGYKDGARVAALHPELDAELACNWPETVELVQGIVPGFDYDDHTELQAMLVGAYSFGFSFGAADCKAEEFKDHFVKSYEEEHGTTLREFQAGFADDDTNLVIVCVGWTEGVAARRQAFKDGTAVNLLDGYEVRS